MNSNHPVNATDRPEVRPEGLSVGSYSSIAAQPFVERTEFPLALAMRSGIAMRSDARPHIAHPNAGAVLVSRWTLASATEQRSAADAFLSAWEGAIWADGMVSVNLLLGADERSVLVYGQWRDIADYQRFSATQRRSIAKQVELAVPGIQRSGPSMYRLYRSAARANAPIPGCIVIVSVAFDTPDSGRQQLWVDTLLTAMEAETESPAGGISGYFHLSEDGRSVLNYAEWTDAQSHEEALAKSGNGSVGSNAKWQLVRNFPGIATHRFERFTFHASLVPYSPLKALAKD